MNRAHASVGALVLAITAAATSVGQSLDDEMAKAAREETLLSMPEPPLEYFAKKQPIVKDGKIVGFNVLVAQESPGPVVIITIELRDLSKRPARVAACKGYVNGRYSALIETGYKLNREASKIPDVESADFASPVAVELRFSKDDDDDLFVSQRIFFTSKGYDVTVMANNEDDLRRLTAWAEQIQPAKSSPER